MECRVKPWSIYTLTDPRTEEVRYVGRTVKDVRHRLWEHMRKAKLGHVHYHNIHWLRQLIAAGLEPWVAVLESGDGDWDEAEKFWIQKLRSEGANLTNQTEGGDGTCGHIPSEETKRKQSASHLGLHRSAETRARQSANSGARIKSPEWIAKIRAANLGRKPPPLAAIRAREVHTGRVKSTEERAHLSAALKGRVFTDEWRKKLSEAQVRRRERERVA